MEDYTSVKRPTSYTIDGLLGLSQSNDKKEASEGGESRGSPSNHNTEHSNGKKSKVLVAVE